MRIGIYHLLGLAYLFSGMGASFDDAPDASARFLIAEVAETDSLNTLQMTNPQRIDLLKSKGYRIVHEREVAYAIPPDYFKQLSNLTDLLRTVELFRRYEVSEIPEESLSLVQQVAQSYNRSPSEFSNITFGVAVVAVFETEQALYQMDILPARASKHEVAAFFLGDQESWDAVVQTYTAGLAGNNRRIPNDLIRGLPTEAQTTQPSVHKGLKTNSNTTRDTRTVILLSQSVPSWRVSEEDKAYFLARYYQLVQREVANERQRWNKVWQRAFQQALGELPDWKDWQGNRWEGSWDQLPAKTRQKLTALLQAKGVTDNLRGSHWRIEAIPYVGFVRQSDIGIYSEWFPAKFTTK